MVTVSRFARRQTDQAWLRYGVMDAIVPDHGHLMHLFLVRMPALDRIWHLHPARQPDGSFVDMLPSVEPGHYTVFADIVGQTGFPWTLVGSIDLPRINGTPLKGDDCGGQALTLTLVVEFCPRRTRATARVWSGIAPAPRFRRTRRRSSASKYRIKTASRRLTWSPIWEWRRTPRSSAPTCKCSRTSIRQAQSRWRR